MRWTKTRSKHAVEAKERLRIARALALLKGEAATTRVRVPRSKVRFTLTIEDARIGDRLRLSLYELPWRGRFVSTDGKKCSTATICRMLKEVLNHE